MADLVNDSFGHDILKGSSENVQLYADIDPARVKLVTRMNLPDPPVHPIMKMEELVQLDTDLREFEAKLALRHKELLETADRCMCLLKIIRAASTLKDEAG